MEFGGEPGSGFGYSQVGEPDVLSGQVRELLRDDLSFDDRREALQ